MEILQKVAQRHNLVCLLHEKPFSGVNGSGKHNNWSLSTREGKNLLDPGETPYENAQFLLFLCAVIKAVDDYQDLLRISVAGAGNDHRLGGNEAPPAIVSIFLGEELSEILDAIEKDKAYDSKEKVQMKIGVHVIPRFPKDTTDRNRTSPFAFTGNKFEFRMLGSTASISEANVVINTAVAESPRQYADELEGASDFETALHQLIQRTIKDHKRIIFNGNGYDDAWVKEAQKRGLYNLKTTPECLPHLVSEKNINLFNQHKVYSEIELHSRLEIMMENYCKVINIEALTMIDMAEKDILPSVSKFIGQLSSNIIASKNACGVVSSYEEETIKRAAELLSLSYSTVKKLKADLLDTKEDVTECANYYKDVVIPDMNALRDFVDELETICAREYWPYPGYGEILFGVR